MKRRSPRSAAAFCLSSAFAKIHSSATPQIVRNASSGYALAFDELVEAVRREERLHVVEAAPSAVEERGLVPFVLVDVGERRHGLVLHPLQHRRGGKGHQRAERAFQSAHGAIAGRGQIRQEQPFLAPPVEAGARLALGMSEHADELAPEALFDDHDDVPGPGRPVVDASGRASVDPRSVEHGRRAALRGLGGERSVVDVVGQLSGARRVHQTVQAVLGDLADDAVGRHVGRKRFEHDRRDHRDGEPPPQTAWRAS
jgi:hypothetical protein